RRHAELEEKLPKDGMVVVAKEDADLLPKYKELGDPKGLKDKLTKGEQAVQELLTVKRMDVAKAFAKAAGLAEEAVPALIAIPALKDATFEVRKTKQKNTQGQEEEVEVPYLTPAGEGQAALTFEDAKEKFPELKGLRTAEAPKNDGGPRRVQFVQQGSKNNGGNGSVYDRIRAEAESRNTPKDKDAKPPVVALEERLRMTR